MEKEDIIKSLAEEKVVEGICSQFGNDEDLKDLAQDIYLDLYTKEEEKLVKMWENKELRWFLVKMVTNNVRSKNSRYYNNYKKFQKLNDDKYLQDNREILPDK